MVFKKKNINQKKRKREYFMIYVKQYIDYYSNVGNLSFFNVL